MRDRRRPPAPTATRHWTLHAIQGVICLASVVAYPGMLDGFDAPKWALLEALGVISLAILMSSMTPWSAGPSGVKPNWNPIDRAVVTWIAAVAIVTFASTDLQLSVVGEISQHEGFLSMAAMGGIYWALRCSAAGAPSARSSTNTLLIIGMGVAGYALLQFAGWDPLAMGAAFRFQAGAELVTRPPSTLGNPVLLGAVVAPALGICTSRLTMKADAGWAQSATFLLLASATLTTLSRGAALASAAAVTLAVVSAIRHRGWSGARASVLRVAILTGVVLAAGVWAMPQALHDRAIEHERGAGTSTGSRLEIARSSIAIWQQHPLTGSGPNTFGLQFPRFQTHEYWARGWEGMPAHAHSVPLQALSTQGIIGVLAGGLLFFSVVFVLGRSIPSRAELVQTRLELLAALAGLGTSGLLNMVGPIGTTEFFVIAACASTLTSPPPLQRRRPAAAGVQAIVGAVALVLFGCGVWPRLVALRTAAHARSGLISFSRKPADSNARLLQAAAQDAKDALRALPHESEVQRLRTDILIEQARLSLAAEDSTVAREIAFTALGECERNWKDVSPRAAHFQRLGALQAIAHRAARSGPRQVSLADAWTAFSDAQRLAPFDARILIERARAELGSRRPDLALITARKITGMYPAAAWGYSAEAAALSASGDRAGARAALEHALRAHWEPDSHEAKAAVIRALGESPR